MYCRHKPDEETFKTHIWMLAKLLHWKNDPRSFLYYVLASCYKKLILRMTHHVSNNYRIALENVPAFTLCGELFPVPSTSEVEYDKTFLRKLLEVQPLLGIEIPNLMGQADNLNFYTPEICNEFHRLLCKLLTVFLDALRTLGKLREDSKDLGKICKQLGWIALLGITLRSMIGGATMKKHLRVIAKFLPDGTALAKQTEDVAAGADADADVDAEFHTIQLHALGPTLPKACNDWLELMVIHYDAAQRLVNYVKSTNGSEVSIKIVSQASPDRYMLPWTTLLSDDRYFPNNDPLLPVADIISFLKPVANPASDAEGFLDPVTDPTANPAPVAESSLDPTSDSTISTTDTNDHQMISAEAFVQRLNEIGKIPKVVETDDGKMWNLEAFTEAIEPIIEKMRRCELANCNSIGWEVYTGTIVKSLVFFQNSWTLTDEVTTAKDIREIVRMVDTMRDNAMIHWALRDGTPLSTGIGFAGNFHAEAILAAYLRLLATGSVSYPFPCRA